MTSKNLTRGDVLHLPQVKLPLTPRYRGGMHNKAGLNWGQRKGREKNQAYIPVSIKVNRKHPDFFPDRAVEFNMITDDGERFICVIAQQNRKAIETSRDNSILGKYFRKRLGVPLDQKVTREDLDKYGRDYVTIYKVDQKTYFMDFTP